MIILLDNLFGKQQSMTIKFVLPYQAKAGRSRAKKWDPAPSYI